MSVESIAIVLHHSRTKGTAKLVMIGIANHDGDGGSWASMQRLATYAGVDISQVKDAVHRLAGHSSRCTPGCKKPVLDEPEIEVIPGGGGQVNTPEHMRTNLYRVLVKCPSNCDGTAQHRRLCLECDEVLPFARYRFNRHTRCERLANDQAVDNYPGVNSPPGVPAPPAPGRIHPPNLLKTTSNPDSSIRSEVTAREAVVECEHAWVEHRGVPWRCVECGIAYAELEAGA